MNRMEVIEVIEVNGVNDDTLVGDASGRTDVANSSNFERNVNFVNFN